MEVVILDIFVQLLKEVYLEFGLRRFHFPDSREGVLIRRFFFLNRNITRSVRNDSGAGKWTEFAI